MAIAHIIILLVTGTGVGFISGLLGVGGAFIMTPVQYLIYIDMGVSSDVAIKLAFGTNLMVVLPTAISGAWRHGKRGFVWWKTAIIMGVCGSVAAFGGATIAAGLPGDILKIAFGVVVIASAVRLLVAAPREVGYEPVNNPWIWVAWAIPIGLATGIIGIGGGLLIIPVMVLALRIQIHRAIATSLAMMIFTSIGGIVGYIVNGLDVTGLPSYSIGYVNLLAGGLLAVTSIGMVQIGAVTTYRLTGRTLRYILVAVMLYVGLKMLGVFAQLGLPI